MRQIPRAEFIFSQMENTDTLIECRMKCFTEKSRKVYWFVIAATILNVLTRTTCFAEHIKIIQTTW